MDIERNERITALASALGATGASLKPVDLDNIHLTLKFLGDTREERVPDIRGIIAEGVRDLKPFKVELAGVGAFPGLRYIQVVWIGVRGAEALVKLASYLEDGLQALGFRRENRAFSPHMTITRVKGSRNMDLLQTAIRERAGEGFGEQLVDRVKLKKSVLTPKGPIYSVVEEIVFGG